MRSYLVIGDCHMPWMSKRSFTRILDILDAEGSQVDCIVQIGDLYDMFSMGRWARSFDLITPKQEITQGRQMAEEFWKSLQKRCPNAECHQLIGNHDERPIKKIIDKAPELASLLDISHLWRFNGVVAQPSEREELELDGICFMHGHRSKLGDHARFNQMPTVTGHSHTGGVVFFPVKDAICWELNAGYIGDPGEAPLQYGKQKKTRWTQGFATIDKYGPRFCPI